MKRKDWEYLGLGALLFAVAFISLWLLLTLAKPVMEFTDKCHEKGGIVVQMKCLDTKEISP